MPSVYDSGLHTLRIEQSDIMKKPKWVVQKEQQKKAASQETIWLFGIHAVQDALRNPQREKLRLVVSKNAADKLVFSFILRPIDFFNLRQERRYFPFFFSTRKKQMPHFPC